MCTGDERSVCVLVWRVCATAPHHNKRRAHRLVLKILRCAAYPGRCAGTSWELEEVATDCADTAAASCWQFSTLPSTSVLVTHCTSLQAFMPGLEVLCDVGHVTWRCTCL